MGESPVLAGQAVTDKVLNGLPVTLSTLVTGSSSASAETIIGTWTIPANDAVAGSGYQFRVIGTADIPSAATLRLHLRLASATGALLMQGAALTSGVTGSNHWWNMRGYLYANAAGSSGSLDGSSWWAEAIQSSTPAEVASGLISQAVDTTSTILLCVTASIGTGAATVRTLDGGLNRI